MALLTAVIITASPNATGQPRSLEPSAPSTDTSPSIEVESSADLVVWTGPVSKMQARGATLLESNELFFACRGDDAPPHPQCRNIGFALKRDPALLYRRARLSHAPRHLALSAFSAGGHVLKRLLRNPDYRRDTSVVTLFDATYVAAWATSTTAPPIEGFVDYAVDVYHADGDKLFIATASPIPNKNWPSGIQTLRGTRLRIEQRLGQSFAREDNFFGVGPEPAAVYRLGNIVFVEFPAEPLGHNHTVIAADVYENIVQPWLDQGKGAIREVIGDGA